MLILLLVACGGEYNTPLNTTGLFWGASAPNRAHATVVVHDRDHKTVDAIEASELTLNEAGAPVSDFVLRTASELDVYQPLVLMLDLSQSTIDDGGLAPMQSAAQTIIDRVDPDHPIQLMSFASDVTVHQSFTTDREALGEALDALGAEGEPSDVWQAAIDAVEDLEDALDPAEAMERGVVVLITDGGDGPATPSLEDAVAARGDRAVITVAVGGAPARSLASFSTAGVVELKEWSELSAAADEVAELVERSRDGTLYLQWCSDQGSDARLVDVSFERDRLKAFWEDTLSGTGDATTGWGEATSLPEHIATHHARVEGGYLYVAGGDWDGNVFYAPVLPDGRLGHFREGTPMPEGSETRMAAGDGALYAINGGLAWYSILGDAGAPGEWVEMDSPGYANIMRVSDGVLYSASRETVFYATTNGGPAGTWGVAEDFPKTLDGYIGFAIAGGHAVAVGAYRESVDQPWESIGFIAPLGSDGAVGDWSTLPSIPDYMGYWSTLDSDGEHLVLFPGSDADAQDILSLKVESSGAVGGWDVASRFTRPREQYSTAVSDTFVYIHGGDLEGDPSRAGLTTRFQDGLLALDCVL